jgi:beta-N-acetylhexosaminidase
MTLTKYTGILAAVSLAFICTACGSLSTTDPTAITKKNEGLSSAEVSEADSSDTDSNSEADSSQTDEADEASPEGTAKKLLAEMSDKEKIGQLFIIRPDALESSFSDSTVYSSSVSGVTWVDDEMKETLESYPVGGVIMFSKNMTDEDQLEKLIDDLQAESYVPLFVGVNEEGGTYSSIANTDGFDVTLFFGADAAADEDSANEMGKTISGYLSDYGFNLDFAPVVNADASSTISSERIFSSDIKTAAQLALAQIKGLHKGGIMSAAKLFPTSGNTDKDMEQLEEDELTGFSSILKSADMIMVGNVETPNATEDGLYASLSKEWITDCLRGDMKYDGVVVTAPQSEEVITSNYSSGDSAVAAVNAGADIVLEPYSLQEAFEAVEAAVKDGTISEERLDESVLRILTLKAEYGLIE